MSRHRAKRQFVCFRQAVAVGCGKAEAMIDLDRLKQGFGTADNYVNKFKVLVLRT